MSKLYITEYRNVGLRIDRVIPVEREGDEVIRRSPLDFSGGKVTSLAFAATTKLVEIWSDVNCLYAVGSAPDATVAGTPMTAQSPKQFTVLDGNKISVVALT